MESYIYVIAVLEDGPVKIGFSKSPDKRLRQLQTGQADVLRLFHSEPIELDKVHLMEQVVHRENRHRKIKGEWFNMSVEDAILEVRHAMIRFEEEVETRSQFIPKNPK